MAAVPLQSRFKIIIIFIPRPIYQNQKIKKITIDFDFSIFKNLWFNLRTDIGASNRFDEIALTQTLDNLRRDGVLNSIQYLERLPDRFLPRKDELIAELRRNLANLKPDSLSEN